MSYKKFRERLATKLAEIAGPESDKSFNAVKIASEFNDMKFPSLMMNAGATSATPDGKGRAMRNFTFDIFIYEEIGSDLETKREKEEKIQDLADELLSFLDTIETFTDIDPDCYFKEIKNGGFGFDQILTNVRFYKVSITLSKRLKT